MINLSMHTQPDDVTCGPTCLHAVYNHYGLRLSLDDVVATVKRSSSGGTITPLLGRHALMHGFKTTIYINNLEVFDPSWFKNGLANREDLIAKLTAQAKYKRHSDAVMQYGRAYQQYLELGGNVRFRTISVQLLKEYFKQKIPILTGLSATYLYGCARERYTEDGVAIYDDIRGTPCGHFVVLCGYDNKKKHIIVADPYRANPLSNDNYYKVGISRLINAIMLGVLTLDGNLLIIQPQGM